MLSPRGAAREKMTFLPISAQRTRREPNASFDGAAQIWTDHQRSSSREASHKVYAIEIGSPLGKSFLFGTHGAISIVLGLYSQTSRVWAKSMAKANLKTMEFERDAAAQIAAIGLWPDLRRALDDQRG